MSYLKDSFEKQKGLLIRVLLKKGAVASTDNTIYKKSIGELVTEYRKIRMMD
ncbi:hypothetical protein GH741_16730 [Aquibacillus halophilus]|uniref:Fur-regulated basic protein FbpA n=1 Tax=Aquibacillus halophilus TaxID=930132 RepID=A0A6A8DKJ2_9BACI|nr:hypothetical protein [Aquibacillus halophilus]MRH44291.1 hypothetical protein [Aquibacillus halophilus]